MAGPAHAKMRSSAALYLAFGLCTAILLLPLLALVLTSFKTFAEAVGPYRWWPSQWNFQNYHEVFTLRDFNYWQYLRNTLFLFMMRTAGTLLTCTLVAYGFVRFNVRHKKLIFTLLLAVILLPSELLSIPMYEVYLKLGWYDTYYPLFVSNFFGTDIFMIFFFRQYFSTIPGEIFNAAQIDGASEFQMYRRIMLPLSVPAITTCVLLYFTSTYNDIYAPLLYISSTDNYTMSLGLRALENVFTSGVSRDAIIPWNLVSAATVLSLIPVGLLFAVAQRQFIEGAARTGIKG